MIKRYIELLCEGVRVRDDECDWCTYHLVAEKEAATIQDLLQCTGLPRDTIEASVDRLVHARLIVRTGDTLRIMSFPEMIILQQIDDDPNCPWIIEQGVIKERRERRA